jgi:hypothetical protein
VTATAAAAAIIARYSMLHLKPPAGKTGVDYAGMSVLTLDRRSITRVDSHHSRRYAGRWSLLLLIQ